MSCKKDKVTDAHRVNRIRLLQEDPDRYFENKRRINFGFVATETKPTTRSNRK
ncbi:hypothetical protein CDES_09135 [Corynebacterium deserti GIMN1.010]|uniref:Uncharacterized protein n=1 Tax=Corynebacterium deserti GIMN1.010 TaxID=931089 RepID=A0A0M3Q9S7_9CORY|nr:hypothetical protein [Corynebacterium deserti]ALC06219.1 hypothetical protein CDES_09135 [Corynebacterium deserti GIMN1.010]